MHSYLDGDLSTDRKKRLCVHTLRGAETARLRSSGCSEARTRSGAILRDVRRERNGASRASGMVCRNDCVARPGRVRWRLQDLIERVPRGVLAPAAVAAVLMLAVWGMEVYETALPAGNGRICAVTEGTGADQGVNPGYGSRTGATVEIAAMRHAISVVLGFALLAGTHSARGDTVDVQVQGMAGTGGQHPSEVGRKAACFRRKYPFRRHRPPRANSGRCSKTCESGTASRFWSSNGTSTR